MVTFDETAVMSLRFPLDGSSDKEVVRGWLDALPKPGNHGKTNIAAALRVRTRGSRGREREGAMAGT